jgi:1,4-alpha-glucan branching enzyme
MPASTAHITASTPMGATLVGSGATFRVWAPNATAVHVRGSFNGFNVQDNALLLKDDAGYWHGFIDGVTSGAHYKYWVTGEAGSGWKRDPYARELREPNWDCVVRQPDFPWHDTGYHTPAFHDFVIYQLHVGAFHAPRFPKTGTFLDVADKIPYLADLGVTAIQLLPIQEFPGNFSLGYNGTDYFSPEMVYAVADADLGPYVERANALLSDKGLAPYRLEDLRGEMNQLKALVDLCHAYGLAVIFDLVFNHAGGDFGDQTLWFFDRQRGVEVPEWWHSLYFSDKTWAGGVVFNFQSDPVRALLIDNARFLLDEYHVDGFRFDEVSVIDHNSYGRGWDFCQALTNTLRRHRPQALLHAEYWNVNPWIVKDPDDSNGAGFHTTMTDGPRIAIRELLAAASDPNSGALPMTRVADQLGLNYLRDRWRGVNSLENHDLVMQPKDHNDHNRMPRIPKVADGSNSHSWYACSRARVATGLLLTMPGIPMLFMGQEFLEDKQWSDDVDGHPELRLFWAGLESADDPAMRDFLRFTRELIALRWRHPALRSEGYALVHVHDANRVLAFQRWVPGAGGDVVVVASLANETRHGYEIGFPKGGHWQEVFNSDVYQRWVNPNVAGNGGGVVANGPARHGLAQSAALTLPANDLLVFSQL